MLRFSCPNFGPGWGRVYVVLRTSRIKICLMQQTNRSSSPQSTHVDAWNMNFCRNKKQSLVPGIKLLIMTQTQQQGNKQLTITLISIIHSLIIDVCLLTDNRLITSKFLSSLLPQEKVSNMIFCNNLVQNFRLILSSRKKYSSFVLGSK